VLFTTRTSEQLHSRPGQFTTHIGLKSRTTRNLDRKEEARTGDNLLTRASNYQNINLHHFCLTRHNITFHVRSDSLKKGIVIPQPLSDGPVPILHGNSTGDL